MRRKGNHEMRWEIVIYVDSGIQSNRVYDDDNDDVCDEK